MWACDVIPWVSWGTIAFITWIYDELIDALNAFNFKTLKLFFTGKRKLFRKEIHGTFLLLVFGGIFVAILTLAKAIDFLLINYPEFIRAFFFGLILASAFLLKNSIKKKFSNRYILRLSMWLALWYWVSALPIISTWTWLGPTFFAWVIAIIAMILPGISGSYILVVLWQYQNILWKLVDIIEGKRESILPILLFMAWAALWLLLFSKVLHYIKTRRHDQLILFLVWLMIGSLNKVRPRKETLETFVDRHGEIQPLVQQNILPDSTEKAIRWLALILLGFMFVFWVEKIAKKLHIEK